MHNVEKNWQMFCGDLNLKNILRMGTFVKLRLKDSLSYEDFWNKMVLKISEETEIINNHKNIFY